MVDPMIVKIADNITSPLGFTTEENYQAVKRGDTRLQRFVNKWSLPEPFIASLFEEGELETAFNHRVKATLPYTRFEQMALLSAIEAITRSGIDAASERCIFILSTTKGNISLLEQGIEGVPDDRLQLSETARAIARFFGNRAEPMVVSNACASGVCAQIVAMRYLESGRYDHAVVIGVDIQSPFIVSGFASFKALSPTACQPFSENRMGLNLGEAAATMVLRRVDEAKGYWQLADGAIRNDAHHISSPSKAAEGSFRALEAVLHRCPLTEELAVINAHGTATLYNDEMEAKAIERAGLLAIPVNAYKGNYGHTMGAAGVLETILTMRGLDEGTILPTRGFDELGVSKPIRVTKECLTTDRQAFIKLISGFGGTNAALRCVKK